MGICRNENGQKITKIISIFIFFWPVGNGKAGIRIIDI
jgi:hypothetical protein